MNSCPSCKSKAFDTDRFCRNCGVVIQQLVPRNVQIGRTLVIVAAIITLVVDAITSLYSLTMASMVSNIETIDCINDLISGSIEIFLFYLIFRGYSWARWLMGLFALLGTAVGLFFLAEYSTISVLMWLSVISAGSIASILLFAPSVRAFQQAQKKARLDRAEK